MASLDSQQKVRIMNAVTEILEALGEDVTREGLVETPKRVAEMYSEIFSSIGKKNQEEYKVFTSEIYDEMILIKDIDFYSMCEHHLVPFFGKAHIAYVPANQKVIGLSKIPRIVEFAAKKPTIQEGMTVEILETIAEVLAPLGIAVMIEAEHMCMAMRGIKKAHSNTITSHYQGVFKEDRELRNEFLRLAKGVF